jgi:hypothetical protein
MIKLIGKHLSYTAKCLMTELPENNTLAPLTSAFQSPWLSPYDSTGVFN